MEATHVNEKARFFNNYLVRESYFDEVFSDDAKVKTFYSNIIKSFNAYTLDEFKTLNEFAKNSFLHQGVTFATYSENVHGVERIFPFDLLPRMIKRKEWETIEKGLIQRTQALNMFLYDIYHEKKIIKDKIIPADLVFSSSNYCKYMVDFDPPGGVYAHISGTDLIRHADGKYYILEDNIRCPSGVSYVLANREIMKKTMSGIFKRFKVSTIVDYPSKLLHTLQSVAPENVDNPTCVVLTPGVYNSAYYEHSFLAQSMGIELVEGSDLYVENDFVYMKTVKGAERVDVIYRRIDDDYIDPLVFRPESVLGVPGIMGAYRKGNVTLINAPGTGVADDKAVYTYVPHFIKYYLGEEPILNNVHTYHCSRDDDRKYVLDHLQDLVVKPVDQSGGYGIFVGEKATKQEIENEKKRINSDPRSYIAQPIMKLSLHSTFIEERQRFEPRHIDLRTFTLLGKDMSYVLKGGLSRVAMKEGSLIVNSSQGGGSKDTWIIEG